MKPPEPYKKLQKELLRLITLSDATRERARIRRQLENMFMTAWQFSPDRLGLSGKLREAIRMFYTSEETSVRGFSQCAYYTAENDQRIIVTQPHDCLPSEIVQDLTLDDGVSPEVTDASDWGFHYPGRASLFIVRFPSDFQKRMEEFERALQQSKIAKALAISESKLP